jgi:hypothetical protein
MLFALHSRAKLRAARWGVVKGGVLGSTLIHDWIAFRGEKMQTNNTQARVLLNFFGIAFCLFLFRVKIFQFSPPSAL